MTTNTTSSQLPFGLWKFTATRLVWALLLACGAAFGVYCFYVQTTEGLVVTGMRTTGSGGAGWGLYIVFDVFFIGVSFAGITVAALIRLFGLSALSRLARMAELLTIVALLLGGMVVIADLGRPLYGLLNLPKYARPDSPFFGTFTMVIGGYLFASLVYFFLAGRADAYLMSQRAPRLKFFYRLWASGYTDTKEQQARHYGTSFWLALFVLPLLVTAHSTLGFIFGIQGGRPGWFSSLQAPNFVVMAGVSGIGVLLIILAAVRTLLKLHEEIPLSAFRWLGNFLWVLIVVTLYFIISDELTSSYAASAHQRHAAHNIATGEFKHLFRLEIGSLLLALLLLFGQFALGKTSVWLTAAAGLSVNVAAVMKRFLLVVPSQTSATMLEWPHGHYAPSWVELGLVGGLVCLGMLMYSVFSWIFPLLPLEPHHAPAVATASADETRRRVIAFGVLGLGLAAAVTGFLLSSRFGTKEYLDPLLPFSPVLFIIGVVAVFGSAAVYETLPSRKTSQGP